MRRSITESPVKEMPRTHGSKARRRHVKLNRLAALPCLSLLLTWGVCHAQIPELAAAIEARVGTLVGDGDLAIDGQAIAAGSAIADFYTRRGFAPAWTDLRNVDDLLRAIAESVDDGLDPADYHLASLVRLRPRLNHPSATNFERADLELLLTDAIFRLGYHLWFGKVDPQRFDNRWNLGRSIPGLDPAAELESALASGHLHEAIERARPAHPLYTALRGELARFRQIALAGGWPELASGPTLEPGAADARVPVLRAILRATGDLQPTAPDALEALDYDTTLEAAVRRYQQRMGLAADGRIGPATLAELRVPVEDRILQLRVNLDRGRVLLYQLPPQFVVVNIAGFEVFYVRGNETIWRSRAQVGTPWRMTPEYRSEMTYLVFNPTWTVPPTIIANDILPGARRDPTSITRRGLKVLDASGRVIDPASVDWSRFRSGHIPYTLRQDPGPANALGRVKFMFPNPYAVYLHDTPSKSRFESDTRTTSSGCVRIEHPFELAKLLLDDPAQWNDATIAAVIARGQTQNVTLQKPVPIMLAYWTAWVDSAGRVNFRRDIYGRDASWAHALNEPFTFRKRPISE